MATRSTIAVRHADNTVSQIYCHWDGYLENNGKILQESYTTLEQAEALVAGGDMSSLDGDHSKCEYYTQRGEELNIRKYATILDYARRRQDEEFNYLWEQGQWKVVSYATDNQWMPLEQAIQELI
jgi:hypothetical protein